MFCFILIIRLKPFFNRGNFEKRIVVFFFSSSLLTGKQPFLLDCNNNNNNNNEYENIHDNEEEDEHKNVFNENDFEINEKVADSGKYTHLVFYKNVVIHGNPLMLGYVIILSLQS